MMGVSIVERASNPRRAHASVGARSDYRATPESAAFSPELRA
jgi:hypothetical protein